MTTTPFFFTSSGGAAHDGPAMATPANPRSAMPSRRRLNGSNMVRLLLGTDELGRHAALPVAGQDEPGLHPTAPQREWPAEDEIHRADHAEYEQRLVGLVGYDLSGAGEFDETDDGRERGAFDQLHEITDGRWQ